MPSVPRRAIISGENFCLYLSAIVFRSKASFHCKVRVEPSSSASGPVLWVHRRQLFQGSHQPHSEAIRIIWARLRPLVLSEVTRMETEKGLWHSMTLHWQWQPVGPITAPLLPLSSNALLPGLLSRLLIWIWWGWTQFWCFSYCLCELGTSLLTAAYSSKTQGHTFPGHLIIAIGTSHTKCFLCTEPHM